MNDVYEYLRERLGGFTKLAILGVGSLLRADDGAGMEIVQRMESRLPEACADVKLFGGETAPENLCGSIKRFQPSHLLIVDAADVGLYPGETTDVRPSDIGGPSYSSHMLPLRLLVDYLISETGMEVSMLGIQYKTLEFDNPMSPEIEAAVERVCDALSKMITVNAQERV